MNVERLARRYHIRPHKGFSQHFLLDQSVLKSTIQHAELSSQSTVLEIGAGVGNLTSALADTGAQVLAFEVDRQFIPLLQETFGTRANVELVFEDFFHWFRQHAHELPKPFSIVANLPYHMTSHFFRTVLETERQPERVVVLVQKEVAERIGAEPGRMSLLSLSVQLYCRPRVVRTVPAVSFWPKPKVDSSLLVLSDIRRASNDVAPLFRLATFAFAGRRKQLVNSLVAGLHKSRPEVVDCLRSVGIKPTVRPQELTLEQWENLAKVFG